MAFIPSKADRKQPILRDCVRYRWRHLAAHNRWKLTTPVTMDDAPARHRLIQSIMVETFLVLVIFGIASGWRFTPSPRPIAIAAAQPASVHIHTNKAMADVTISPGRIGSVDVWAVIMTGDFGPFDARKLRR